MDLSVLPYVDSLIINNTPQGASASRNTGADSIQDANRQKYVMFVDDDCWFAPNYDVILERLLELPNAFVSGYSHPFNLSTGIRVHVKWDGPPSGQPLWTHEFDCAGVLSSVAMAMPWEAFDKFGPWDLPGGPGSSEDVAICSRAAKAGYQFATTRPHCVIHAGLVSSNGEKIVGYDLLEEQNANLEILYQVKGKVLYA